MHGNNTGMFQARDDLRFTNHSVAQICGELRRVEDFDSDETIKLAIFSQTNYSHPAASELFHKRVLRRTEIRLTHDAAQVFQLVVRKPSHFASTPSNERASVRNSSSVAVISRSFSRTMRRKSRRAAAR